MKQDKQILETSLKELKEKNEKLELYITELEEFTSLVCHELQEPLRKIKSYGLLVKEKQTALTPEVDTYLSHMINGTEHIKNLITSLLELSRASKKDLFMERVNLNQVITSVLQELESAIRESGATITIAQTIPSVRADALQMHQLFLKIIANALKFGKKEPVIVIHFDRYFDFVRLMIQDNGIGIPAKYTEKIFTPFFSLNSAKMESGTTGMGLSICKKIIERHSGHIYAESNERLGTIIIVELPIYHETEEELLA